MIIYPNQSRVLTFFRKYVVPIRKMDFHGHPTFRKKRIALSAWNFDSERVKVNDKRENPILMSVMLVWRVYETHRAGLEVDE